MGVRTHDTLCAVARHCVTHFHYFPCVRLLIFPNSVYYTAVFNPDKLRRVPLPMASPDSERFRKVPKCFGQFRKVMGGCSAAPSIKVAHIPESSKAQVAGAGCRRRFWRVLEGSFFEASGGASGARCRWFRRVVVRWFRCRAPEKVRGGFGAAACLANSVPEKVTEKVWEAVVQSHVGFTSVGRRLFEAF